ncbi:MAG: rod-binding protein [Desulfovibrionaceae bacterium]|nr:rod-binding protein [Desulfovibrionaceae bacterium]
MIKSTLNPDLAARQSDAADLIRFKRQMDGLKERLTSGENKETQLREACRNFEAVFISKLWQQMKQSVPKEGYLHSRQEESYEAMFDRDFAEKMAKAGGIGLADMIYEQLSEKLKEVSRDTLSGGVDIKPLAAEPIPLVRGRKVAPLSGEQKGMTLEDWGGRESVSESEAVRDAAGKTASAPAETREPRRELTDLEVRARLEALVRRIESERFGTSVAEVNPAGESDG